MADSNGFGLKYCNKGHLDISAWTKLIPSMANS